MKSHIPTGIRSILRKWLIYVVATAVFGSLLEAADDYEAAVRPISEKIRIDGVLDEPAWQENPSLTNLLQVEPNPGAQPSEATKVWLAYDKDSFYIAVRCEDGNPEKIVATEMGRDAKLMNMNFGINDNLEIILDTYHDQRNAYYFATNSAGSLVDGRVTENQEPAMEWDGIWNVRTRIDSEGWTAEFEIPFKTLGYNPGISTWGFNISRYIARGRETIRWASPSLDVKIHHVVRAGRIAGIESPSQGIGLDIKPYGITGFTRDVARKDRVQGEGDGGFDMFYRITANLVSSTTVNTDFAETEVDTRQVNLTRFPLFFPEKRTFFLEDAGIFEFAKQEIQGPPNMSMGSDLLPFFSRRIGLVQGNEVPIWVGQKLTGKIGRFDLGLMTVQTGTFTEDERLDAGDEQAPPLRLPSKNLSVGRVKTNFLSQSYVGAMFTNGDPTGQTSNQMGGIDLKLATSNFLNRQKNLSLMLFATKTRTSGLKNRDNSYGGIISYPNDLFEFQYRWMKIGEQYNPALGFVPRKGVRISSFAAGFGPRPEFWTIRQMSFEVRYTDYYKLDRGTWETKEMTVNPLRLRFDSGEFIGYEWRWYREHLFEEWFINPNNGIGLPPGEYNYNDHNFFLMTSQSRPFSVRSEFGVGSYYSGTRRRLKGEFTWRKDRHLTTSFDFEQNWIRLKEGDFNTSLAMFRLDYSFTPFVTLANFVQYDTDSRNIGLQSRLRWILTPGKEFFVVLNHSWQENELDRFVPAQTRFRVKLNYTFRF
jgi:hypothetical protein